MRHIWAPFKRPRGKNFGTRGVHVKYTFSTRTAQPSAEHSNFGGRLLRLFTAHPPVCSEYWGGYPWRGGDAFRPFRALFGRAWEKVLPSPKEPAFPVGACSEGTTNHDVRKFWHYPTPHAGCACAHGGCMAAACGAHGCMVAARSLHGHAREGLSCQRP